MFVQDDEQAFFGDGQDFLQRGDDVGREGGLGAAASFAEMELANLFECPIRHIGGFGQAVLSFQIIEIGHSDECFVMLENGDAVFCETDIDFDAGHAHLPCADDAFDAVFRIVACIAAMGDDKRAFGIFDVQ